MGVPPRRLTGWEPTRRTWKVKGVRRTVIEPEWDWVDRAIVTEWERLAERLCRQCGRPIQMHEAEAAACADAPDPYEAASGEYGVAYLVCPATLALDRVQAATEKQDEPARAKGLTPDRARTWITWHSSEGVPSIPD